jgi:hypothetical protein
MEINLDQIKTLYLCAEIAIAETTIQMQQDIPVDQYNNLAEFREQARDIAQLLKQEIVKYT